MFTLNYQKEVELFNQRNEKLLKILPELKSAIDDVLRQINSKAKTKNDLAIYGLGLIWALHKN